jgi:hypothetical protein
MKIREIPKHVDFSSLVERNDLSKPALAVLATALGRGDLNIFVQQEGNLDEYSRDGMISLLQLRSSNLRQQGRECHGFEEALAAVTALDDTRRICWMAVPTAGHLLILLLEVSSYAVLACMSLKRIAKDKPTPPPNWDGSNLA